MGDGRKLSAGRSGPRRSRLTIGLLIGRLTDFGYAANVWPGVADVAEERDVNLICFVGGALNAPHEFDSQRNVIYDLVSPQKVDGLVTMSGSIGQFVGPERLRQFFERYRPLPIVSIAMELEGLPSVLVDNETGMREAINHLVEVHGLRRIAFLRGPETNTEAQQRYQAYLDVLTRHGIPFDPGLIACGNYLARSGEAAVRLLLDERRVDFQAIASANDEMALGAMAELRRRNLRVPEDVCVVGFDDLEEARYSAPPLTTVRQPLYEQGRRAAEMLLSLLEGGETPECVRLPTTLVVRQSCGCFPSAQFESFDGMAAQSVTISQGNIPPQREHVLAEIAAAAGDTAAVLDPGWAGELWDAFIASAGRSSEKHFLLLLDSCLRKVGMAGKDVMQWLRVVALLRQFGLSFVQAESHSQLSSLCHQADSLVRDVAQWAQVYRRQQSERRAFDFTINISEPLLTAFDIDGLTDTIVRQLPQVGIRACYLSLYEQGKGKQQAIPSPWSRLILAYDERGRMALKPGGVRFRSHMLVPADLLPEGERQAIMVEALHFRDETQLGFIVFKPLHPEVGILREALTRQISTALKGALLLQERKRAEEKLRQSEHAERRFQERLRALIEVGNDLSRANSVDALCRQAVELGRKRLGFDRMGIWFRSPEPGFVTGSWGTDEQGNLRDERGIRVAASSDDEDVLTQKSPLTKRQKATHLLGKSGDIVGFGMRAQAAMWDGEKTIGLIAIDNLLQRRPITDQDCEVLNLYASTLGYLCSRKWAEEALRKEEEAQRLFSERLERLLSMLNELSRIDSFDELCRQSVQMAIERLGFDRVGLCFLSEDQQMILGAYGTDETGHLREEKRLRRPVEESSTVKQLLQNPQPVVFFENEVLYNDKLEQVGMGAHAIARLWNGEKIIGIYAVDNLLSHRPISLEDLEILELYGTAMGHLFTLKKTDEALKEYSERLEEMVAERTQELQDALQKAQAADRLKTEFVANINHELRTPLTNLLLYYQILQAQPGVKVEERLAVIGRELQRLKHLIEDLLNLSRLDLGQAAFQPVRSDFNLLVQTLVNDRRSLAEERGLILRMDLQPDLPWVWMDEAMITQVISNLLTNALNYTPRGGEVHIRTVSEEFSGKPGVALSVQDTGPGVNEQDLPHIFERFYRGKAGRETAAPGTGLGLSIAKEIVEKHGGCIKAGNVPGQHGAVFTVWLPLEARSSL